MRQEIILLGALSAFAEDYGFCSWMNARKRIASADVRRGGKAILNNESADNPAEYTEIIARKFRYILRGGVNACTTGFARWAPFLFLLLCSAFNTNSGADSKKVLMVIANNGFRDEEFKVPFEALRNEGFEVVVASSSLSTAKGMLGLSVKPDILLSAVKTSDYDAIIFIGGAGAQEFWDDVNAHELAKGMYRDGKIVSAICIAPVILANAGVLDGKKATVWNSESYMLDSKGAHYTGKPVEIDGNIITANGPQSAEEFVQEIIKKLEE